MAAAAPLDATPRDLKTASLPAHLAANEAAGLGWALQYAISSLVKFRDTKVGLSDGTAEINSIKQLAQNKVQKRMTCHDQHRRQRYCQPWRMIQR